MGCNCRPKFRTHLFSPLKLDLLLTALPPKQVDQHPDQNNHEHYAGHGGTHERICRLQLVTKECPEEKCTQDIGGEIWSGQRPLGHIDQFEGVKVSYESRYCYQSDRWENQRELDLPKDLPTTGAVYSSGFHQVIGNSD